MGRMFRAHLRVLEFALENLVITKRVDILVNKINLLSLEQLEKLIGLIENETI